MCRLCPYMKATDLEKILRVLEKPTRSHSIVLSPRLCERARKPIEKMFELSEDTARS
jgi:quinolinate synthase